jgi:hypothetical protein
LWQESIHGRTKLKSLFPLFATISEPGEKGFFTLPLSFGNDGDSSFVNLGALLFHRAKTEHRVKTWLAAKLIGWERDRDENLLRSIYAFPLFGFDRHGDYTSFSSLIYNSRVAKKDLDGLKELIVERLPTRSVPPIKEKDYRRRFSALYN